MRRRLGEISSPTRLDRRTDKVFSINSFAQFKAPVTRPDGSTITLHFVHERAPQPHLARTILLLHGWPGSYLEFLDVVDILKKTGEYNIVVPSHPGYAFSDPPPEGEDFKREDVADLMESLMQGLGYKTYATQVRSQIYSATFDGMAADLLL